MITDALLQLSSSQTVTASAVSTNTIDLGSRDTGAGADLYVHFSTDVSATAAGAATVQFQVISSASANLSSPFVLASTGPIDKSELTAGRRPITLEVPAFLLAALPFGQRYLGAQYVVATGPLTAGMFSASLSDSKADFGKSYASTARPY